MLDPIPSKNDFATYNISVSVNAELNENADWFEPYITSLDIFISQQWSDDQQRIISREAGKGEAIILHVGNAMNDGEEIAEACDAHSAEAHEYRSAVLAVNNEWRDDVDKQFGGELFEHDVLAFTKLEIKQEHRGQKLGLLSLLRTMNIFSGGCGLTLIKPWPLQYTSKEFDEIEATGRTSQGWTARKRDLEFAKLRSYWSQLGFERIEATDFYAFPHFKPLPSIQAILSKNKQGRSRKKTRK
jgi:hypothetical protein